MKVSIQKFQELHRISMLNIDELEKSTLLVQAITDKTMNEINDMKMSVFNKKCRDIKKAFDIFAIKMDEKKPKSIVKANGRWYHINYDLTKHPNNSAKYVELATFSQDIISNLHKIMATMCTPMKWTLKGLKIDDKKREHRDIAEDMLELDFNVAYHCGVFFYALLMKSMEDFPNYSQLSQSQRIEVMKVLTNLQNTLAGFITAKWYQNLKISA